MAWSRGPASPVSGGITAVRRARMSNLCLLVLLLGPGATLAFQMSAPRGRPRSRCATARCTEPAPEPAEPTPEIAEYALERKEEDITLAAELLAEPAVSGKQDDFTLVAGAKELQRVLVTGGFGLQVGAATLVFGGAMYWSTVALSSDPFWSSPILPQ